MSAILTWLTEQGGALAVGYLLPRVTQKLSTTLWGRLLLFFARRKLKPRRSASHALIEKLGKQGLLTSRQLAKLTPKERQILEHSQT